MFNSISLFRILIFLFCFQFAFKYSFGQKNRTIDSLLNQLATQKKYEIQSKTNFELFRIYYYSYSDSAIDYAEQGLTLAEKCNKKSDMALFHNACGQFYIQKGNYTSALEHHLNALRLREELNNKKDIASSLNNIGLVYQNIGEYTKSLNYYIKALEINKEIPNKEGIAHNLGNIAILYSKNKLYDQSIKNGLEALKLWKELDNYEFIASSLGNLGATYHAKKEYSTAIKYYKEALNVDKQIKDINGIAIILQNIGELYLEQKHIDSAFSFISQSLQIAKSINNQEIMSNNYLTLSDIYSQQNNFKEAYKYHVLFYTLSHNLLNEKITEQMSDLSTKYESEKKELQIKNLKQEQILKETQITHQKSINYFTVACLVLLIGIAFFIFKNFTEKKKLSESLTEKNKEITDSINYAKRIQEAILPPYQVFSELLPHNFILYKPKDIVSGDFYWIKETESEIILAAVDCTGHGVPGAFMSMIGSEKLNDAALQSSNISEILTQLNKGIKTSLRQSDNYESTRDGMDIAICSVNIKSRIVKYAGANRPFWVIRNEKKEIEEIKATKKAIGGLTDDNQEFASHEIKLQQGDTFYIFTDGYSDQFSGHDGKKLMTKKFKEILLSLQNYTMQDQQKYLNDFIENWKAGTEQVDDILIIGVRL